MPPLLHVVSLEEDVFHIRRETPFLPVQAVAEMINNTRRVHKDGVLRHILDGVEDDISALDARINAIRSFSYW